MNDLRQHVPGGGGRDDGRLATAALIKSVHRQRGQDLVKQHFAAAAKDHGPQREAVTHSERFLHLTLSDPTGDRLRKCKPPGTALGAIKKALAQPRPLQLGDSFPPQSSNSRWDDRRSPNDGAELAHDAVEQDRQRAGARPKPPLLGPTHEASIRVGRPPPEDQDTTTKAIAEIHRQGPRPLWG